jgi:hypothetical protein
MAKKPATKPVAETEIITTVNETKQKEHKMSDKSTILELDMDLDQVEDFQPLPDGEYPASVTQAEMRTSDKGNDYYYMIFQIHPNDFPADYAPENAPEGMNLVYARVQRPDPKNRRSITGVKNLMRALGISLKTSTINPGDWEGKKAKLRVKKQEWNGEVINSIVAVESLD